MRELRPPEIQVKASSASFAPVLLIVEMLSHWVTGSLHTHTHSLRSFKDMNIVELKATALCVLQTYPWASPRPLRSAPAARGPLESARNGEHPKRLPDAPVVAHALRARSLDETPVFWFGSFIPYLKLVRNWYSRLP